MKQVKRNALMLFAVAVGLFALVPAQCRSSKDFGPRTLFAKRRFLVPT